MDVRSCTSKADMGFIDTSNLVAATGFGGAGSASTRTVRSIIEQLAMTESCCEFLVCAESRRAATFHNLNEFAIRLHRHLKSLGVSAGDRVAFLLGNGIFTAELFLGLMYGGFVAVPLNPLAGPDAIADILQNSQAKVLYVSAEYHELLSRLDFSFRPIHVLRCDEIDGLQMDDAGNPEMPHLEPDADALIAYTSGSTGKPKGALFSHKNLIAGGLNTAAAHALLPSDRSLLVLPLYHMNAQVVTLMSCLVSGGSVVIPRNLVIDQFWNLVSTCSCTWFALVPTIVSQLVDRSAGFDPAQKQHVRFARSSSAPLSKLAHRTFEQTFKLPLIEAMGMTEAGGAIFSNPLPPMRRKIGSPGIPYGFEVRVVDDELIPVSTGQSGEILLRGASVMKGYFGCVETDQITADGFLRTGDVGWQDDEGFIHIVGRTVDIVNKGGEKIAPREVEEALLKHACVAEAAVVSVPDPFWGQDLVAFIATKRGRSCSSRELHQYCARVLGELKTPGHFEFMPELPKGTALKIDRRALKKLALERNGEALVVPQPAGFTTGKLDDETKAIANVVLSAMRRLLNSDCISAADSFFQAGGYSLLGLRLLTELIGKFDVQIPIVALLANPTANSLSMYIRRLQGFEDKPRNCSLVRLSPPSAFHRQNLFVTPGGTGGEEELLVYSRFISFLPKEFACYGLRARSSISVLTAHTSVEQMASDYILEIRQLQPTGPYYLLGECSGGVVAYEIARQLRELREEVAFLGLLDCRAPDFVFENLERVRRFTSYMVRAAIGNRNTASGETSGSENPVARKANDARWLAYKRPLLRYRPRPYPGNVVLFLSDEYYAGNVQKSWERISLSGILYTRILTGDHYSYIRSHAEANGSIISHLLADSLAKTAVRL